MHLVYISRYSILLRVSARVDATFSESVDNIVLRRSVHYIQTTMYPAA